MADVAYDRALYGLHGRTPGSPCPTRCRPGCDDSCHERHKPAGHRLHDEFYCGQIVLGRDVSEYRPEIRREREDRLRAARARADTRSWADAAFGRADGDGLFTGDDGHFGYRKPRWPVRLLVRLRLWRKRAH